MPTQVTNYQCPSCTGPLHYSGASGKLECDYCGSSYTVAEIEALYKEKEQRPPRRLKRRILPRRAATTAARGTPPP